MGFNSYREESKLNYGTENSGMSLEQINAGSLQRIADATEKMASNYIKMEADLKWYKEKYQERCKEINRLIRVISGLRGYIKKVKNQKK